MPQMMNLGVSPSEVTPGGTVTVTWNHPTTPIPGTATIMPTPTNADFAASPVNLHFMTSITIQVPFGVTPGVVTFAAVESAGNAVPGVEHNPFVISIASLTTTDSNTTTVTSLTSPTSPIPTASSTPPSDTAMFSSTLSQGGLSFTSTTSTLKLPGETFSSSTSITSSTSTTPSSSSENSKSSIPIGVIVGCVVGAIAGIAIISLAIWFVQTHKSRSGEIHEQNALLFNRDTTEGNDGVLEPFDLRPDFGYSNATSTPVLSATNFTGMIHSNPSGVIVHKRRDISVEPSMGEPPLSNGRRVSYYMPSSTPRRELDAGPIGHESQSEGEVTLPPNYSDVFAGSRSSSETIVPLPSTSHQKS
ncbi:hypothetical protein BDQ17DRAFT_1437150 [Cyathus striatus]|nr:hypothetical protein BDQ17DRAFT_1437150 [Cyathus striatus]